MEFVLDGLHQNSKIAKDEVDHATSYKDMVGSIFTGQGKDVRGRLSDEISAIRDGAPIPQPMSNACSS